MFGKKNEEIRIEVPYSELTLEEALWRLRTHDGEGWFDADKQAMILVE